MRALAITDASRNPAMLSLPTSAEADALAKVLARPNRVERFTALGLLAMPVGREACAAHVREETAACGRCCTETPIRVRRASSPGPGRLGTPFPCWGHGWPGRGRKTGWPLEAHPGIADLALYPYTRFAPMGGIAPGSVPATAAWVERLRRLSGYQPLFPGRPDMGLATTETEDTA